MSPEVIGLIAGGAVGAVLLVRRLGFHSGGAPSVVGQRAVVTTPVSWRSQGRIRLEDGEEWPARTVPPQRFEVGDVVVVAWIDQLGRRLYVGPADRALAVRPGFQLRFFVLGAVGAAMVAGVLLLSDRFGWSPASAMAAAGLAAAVAVGIPATVWAVRRRRELERFLGRAAVVRIPATAGRGHVEVEIDGQLLPAVAAGPLPALGEWVEVVAVAGWSGLVVKPTER